jgi:hypothetical protein
LILKTLTVDDVRRSIQTYILPIFHPSSSVAFVVCAPSKADEIAQSFASHEGGYDVERRELEVLPKELEDLESEMNEDACDSCGDGSRSSDREG